MYDAEECYKPSGARLLWCDEGYWTTFLQKQGLKSTCSVRDIEKFLLSEFSLLSKAHFKPNSLHPLVAMNGSMMAMRPPMFNRTLVRNVGDRLFDVKGAGLPPSGLPSAGKYSSGLCFLHRCVVEAFVEKVVRSCLQINSPLTTVRSLAIIGLPLAIPIDDQCPITLPAALLVREHFFRDFGTANGRPKHGGNVAEATLRLELFLRQYGITSASRQSLRKFQFSGERQEFFYQKGLSKETATLLNYANTHMEKCSEQSFEQVNIQLAYGATDYSNAAVIDFEHFEHRIEFAHSLFQIEISGKRKVIRVLPKSHPDFIHGVTRASPVAEKLRKHFVCFEVEQGSLQIEFEELVSEVVALWSKEREFTPEFRALIEEALA